MTAGATGFTELRVHGVSGTPPESMLEHPHPERVAGDGEAYRYLVESIRRFPRPEAFADMMRAAGFGRVSFQRMAGGIVALHSGWRL